MNKKIGILTFHRARNIGTCLQAFALQKYLNTYDKEVEIIDYRPQYIEDSFGVFIKDLYRNVKGNLREEILFWVKTILKFPFSCVREWKFYRYRKSKLNISNTIYNTKESMKNLQPCYSHIFFGSDQIWNPQLTNGIDNIFFGNFSAGKTVKASYAASLGANELSLEEKNKLEKEIGNLDFVGVREKSAKNTLFNLGVKDIFVNIDPTLLLDEEIWYADLNPVRVKQKYILVYTLEINDELINIANKVAEEKNLKVVTLDMKNRYGKRGIIRYTASPSEFLSYVKNCEYVITNSFHGTVFSIIFKKKFLSIPHKTRSTRVKDLLESLGLERRLVYTESACIDIDEGIDYDSVQDRLEILRQDSRRYIDMVLQMKR